MTRLLSISAAADRLGCSVDGVRDLAERGVLKSVRTSGGHRRFRVEDLEDLDLGAPSPVLNFPVVPRPKLVPESHGPPEVPPWEDRVGEEAADLKILKIHREARELEEEDRRRRGQEARQAEVAERRRREGERLDGLRSYGLELTQSVPVGWQARVVRDLERYISIEQFPPSLTDGQARSFVEARVQRVLNPYRDALARAEEKERREAQRKILIDGGNSSAQLRALFWKPDELQEEACQEVEAELADRVDADWTEAEVSDLVDDILKDAKEDWET